MEIPNIRDCSSIFLGGDRPPVYCPDRRFDDPLFRLRHLHAVPIECRVDKLLYGHEASKLRDGLVQLSLSVGDDCYCHRAPGDRHGVYDLPNESGRNESL